LTYALVIPADDNSSAESSISIYEKVHKALSDALTGPGRSPVIVNDGSNFARSTGPDGAACPNHCCFANPVRADVLIDGHKVAGAAQRRTRHGLLQQGSIQGIELEAGLREHFSEALSTNCRERTIHKEILNRAAELTEQKYGAKSWLRKR
jgi:lipoate-protein ligase A